MELAIGLVLALFVVQTLLAPSLRYLGAGPGVVDRLRVALGPRDTQPPETPLSSRAARALVNLQEALPVFLPVALLHVVHGTGDAAAGWAYAFLVARIVYVPAYLSGVPGLRSAVWSASWIGLGGLLVTWITTGSR
ncbi:MAG: MAPEG family protein [Myxococcota bacterium]